MKVFRKTNENAGFTLIELLVTIAIISVLSAVIYASFDDARKQARDKTRLADLKSLQLQIELYKAQYDRYPDQGCGTPGTEFAGPGPFNATSNFKNCSDYIKGHAAGITFVPDFISVLPTDPKFESAASQGFYYMTNAAGSAYKLMIYDVVESQTVSSWGNEYARCPKAGGTYCPASTPSGANTKTYAVYSLGAEQW